MVDGFVSFISCPGPAVAYSHITCLDVILYVEMNRGSITGSGSMALRQTIRDLTVLHIMAEGRSNHIDFRWNFICDVVWVTDQAPGGQKGKELNDFLRNL